MATTYKNLITTHFKTLEKNSNPTSFEQVKRNHMTALRSFIAYAGQSETSPVGTEMADEFAETLMAHLSASKLSKRSQTDRRSLLNSWRESYISMNSEPIRKSSRERRRAVDVPPIQNPFEKVLWDSLKNSSLTPKSAAKLAGISVSAVSRWSRGALPNLRTLESLSKLDTVLNLETGTMLASFHQASGKISGAPVNEYRQRLRANSLHHYCIGINEIRPELLNEWKAHLRYKTAPNTENLKRENRGRWTLNEARHSTTKPSVITSVGNSVSASAGLLWSRTSSFLGYLRLAVDSGGFGLDDETAQTLAWFAVPEAIEGFFQFITDRSNGLKHGGQEGFCASVIALLHPEYGYLGQCPNYSEKLPAHIVNGRSWEELCKNSRASAKSLKNDCVDKSRDPEEPIRTLLALEQPLAPIFDAMRKLRKIGDACPKNSIEEAVARRNEILLGVLVSNPLRSKNIITMTYKTDNTGDVYRTEIGQWRIRLSANRMKNKKSKKKKIYNAPLPSWLTPLLDDYVTKFRPILENGKKNDSFFLSNRGQRFNSMNKQVYKLTSTLIPNCAGFGPHALRHLVATDWLMKNPNDFATVSELLNDSIEVIMNNYIHLRKDIAFSRYENYVKNILPGGVY
jgi:integrase